MKSTVAPMPVQSHYGGTVKESMAFCKSSMMTSALNPGFGVGRFPIQQSEMMAAPLPSSVDFTTAKHTRSGVQSKPDPKKDAKKDNKQENGKKKKDKGPCLIF